MHNRRGGTCRTCHRRHRQAHRQERYQAGLGVVYGTAYAAGWLYRLLGGRSAR